MENKEKAKETVCVLCLKDQEPNKLGPKSLPLVFPTRELSEALSFLGKVNICEPSIPCGPLALLLSTILNHEDKHKRRGRFPFPQISKEPRSSSHVDSSTK